MTRAVALVAALILADVLPAGAATVAEGVFGADLLAGVKQPTVLHYRYEMQGQGIDPPNVQPVAMDVREVKPDGAKSVYFDLFEGVNRRQFGPMAAQEQNPLILVLLQRDVSEMGKLTGGAAGYFQQQVRRAFNEPAESTPVEITVGERKLPATRLMMQPFKNDPHLKQFPQFRDKSYEFVVAEGVPGGLYQLVTRVPDTKDGHLILQESVTFEEATP